MIEAVLLERNQSEFAAMMFAMTGFARLCLGGRLSMEPSRFLNVGSDPLMTGEAFSILSLARK